MTVYLILFIAAALGIPLCASEAGEKGIKPKIMLYCATVCAALTVISAVRLSVGYDYNLYAGVFHELNFMDDSEIWEMRREKGFVFIMKLVNILSADYAVFFAVLSVIIYPLLINYIFRYSDNFPCSITAFLAFGVFFNSLNFIPQFIAAIICAYAFKYAEKGCIWRFVMLTVLACAFHRSALIILPCFIFAYIGWNKITLAVSSLGSAVMFAFSEHILNFVTKYVYTYYDLNSNPEITNGLTPYYTVMYALLFIGAYLMRNRIRGSERERSILLWCSFAAFFFELIGIRFAVVSRFALLFFIPAVTLLAPKLTEAICSYAEEKKGRGMKKAAAVMMCVLMAANYGVLIHNNYNGAVPYQTVFSREGGGPFG